jgi:putative phosphoribosyl transferase
MARRRWPPRLRALDDLVLESAYFDDREDAGRRIAAALSRELGTERDILVLGLPRGGIAVAAPVADALDAELDALIVRKIGAPHQPELAIGAVASGGIHVVDEGMVRRLGIDDERLKEMIASESAEVARRESVYRAGRGPLRVANRTVVLVDDGIATGSTMLAAVRLVRTLGARRVVVAVGVAPEESVDVFERAADLFVRVETPEPFVAVGVWFVDFHPMNDEEVCSILSKARNRRAAAHHHAQ